MKSQLTLGKMIEILQAMPPDAIVGNLSVPHSYRGYYEDLCFEWKHGVRRADLLLNDCTACVNREFTGYKGGDYTMKLNTPVWVAEYGCCGARLINIGEDGCIETEEDSY
jgi:hypothetical protein